MIALVEYRATRTRLCRIDLDHLLRMVKGSAAATVDRVIESITPTSTPGEYEVTPGPFVGRLGLPSGEWIDIRSRFPFNDVLELIRRAGRLPLHADRLRTPAGVSPFLIDVLASAFAREVEHLVGQGLAKGYRPVRFERPPYPGMPDVTWHLARYGGRADRLVTTAKRITHDIDPNRALALALDVLQQVRLAAGVGHDIARLGGTFNRIGRQRMSAGDIARLPLSRLTARYAPALALAELIVGGQTLAPEAGAQPGSSILFNMPRVWEAFVGKWACAEWGSEFRVLAPYPFDLTEDGTLRSEADVTVWDQDGRLAALYDAKYKAPGGSPSMGDVYQMVTYCTRLGIVEATLVYPGPVPPRSFNVSGTVISMQGLALWDQPKVVGWPTKVNTVLTSAPAPGTPA